MQSFPRPGTTKAARLLASAVYVASLASLALVASPAYLGCNDTPGPPSGPGNVLIDDSMQDAVAMLTQDSGTSDVYAPQGASDGGSYFDGPPGASTGYSDVQSPQAACASCTCNKKIGYCLENGSSATVTAAPYANGACAVAPASMPSVGCNPLPAACTANPSCGCILDNVQLPSGCYAQCSNSAGYYDLYCPTP